MTNSSYITYKVIKILKVVLKLKFNENFKNNFKLIDNRVLDSFDIILLISELENEFDIEIKVEDMLNENFQSINDIVKLMKKYIENE